MDQDAVRAAEAPGRPSRRGEGGGGLRLLLAVGGGVLLLDVVTKWMVVRSMVLGQSIPVLGDVVRLTYIRNPGAAFGLHLGDHSRLIFTVVTILAIVLLGWMYYRTPPVDRLRLVALALLLGGATGNLLDRIQHADGVVDFVDVGLGTLRWPVFNVADSGITIGAILLAVSLWREESGREEEGERSGNRGSSGDPPDDDG